MNLFSSSLKLEVKVSAEAFTYYYVYVNNFEDIKAYANIIENRMDDEGCTLESLLEDNAEMLRLAQQYGADYILIDNRYKADIDL